MKIIQDCDRNTEFYIVRTFLENRCSDADFIADCIVKQFIKKHLVIAYCISIMVHPFLIFKMNCKICWFSAQCTSSGGTLCFQDRLLRADIVRIMGIIPNHHCPIFFPMRFCAANIISDFIYKFIYISEKFFFEIL